MGSVSDRAPASFPPTAVLCGQHQGKPWPLSRADDPDQWLESAYRNMPILIQLDDGQTAWPDISGELVLSMPAALDMGDGVQGYRPVHPITGCSRPPPSGSVNFPTPESPRPHQMGWSQPPMRTDFGRQRAPGALHRAGEWHCDWLARWPDRSAPATSRSLSRVPEIVSPGSGPWPETTRPPQHEDGRRVVGRAIRI